ncbi:hypothetical protein [Chiayiivirga flava]|uniref:Cation/multidrug efflux pump n=1 Tax=Chiayiivirga flava TaxID=659595 RepID=A0A7W8D700_9GAMM|nr:hypothetical protein [Chiayiivirga flava]MBB5207423.1 hypothetical protein [Chiayiivirga flava]
MSPFWFVLIPALACAMFALIFVGGMRKCARKRRYGGAGLRLVLVIGFALAAIGLAALSAALYHYLELDGETQVATLALRQVEPQRYTATLKTADGGVRTFEIAGDEWQLDARVIKWQLPALLAGAPPLYRLERLSGRYGDPKQEREATRSVHPLSQDAFPDLWTIKRQFPQYLPFVDTEYGSAAYLPMLDGATYAISLGGRGGLIARPANDSTRRLLENAGW